MRLLAIGFVIAALTAATWPVFALKINTGVSNARYSGSERRCLHVGAWGYDIATANAHNYCKADIVITLLTTKTTDPTKVGGPESTKQVPFQIQYKHTDNKLPPDGKGIFDLNKSVDCTPSFVEKDTICSRFLLPEDSMFTFPIATGKSFEIRAEIPEEDDELIVTADYVGKGVNWQ